MTTVQPTILQVLPALDTGGVERGAIEMAIAIQKAGARPIVASEGGRLVPRLRRLNIMHVTLPLSRKSPLAIWRNRRALTALIRKEGVDLIHSRSRAPSWAALGAAKKCRIPFVTTWHGVHKAGFPGKKRYNSVLTRGDRVIAISDYIARRMRQEFKIGDDKLRTIYRGVDVARFDPDQFLGQRVQNLAIRFDLPPDAKIILMPGRLTRWKGQLLLVEALAKLKTTLPWKCVFVGPAEPTSPFVKELESRIHAHGLQEKIRFVGTQDDMPAVYAMADVVVVPSLRPEPFGRVIVEAQAMGCPVIVSGQGGAVETVLDEQTGLVIPPNDKTALAQAIDILLDIDADSRAYIRTTARQNVMQHYTMALMQSQTLAVYDELLHTELAPMLLQSLMTPEETWPPRRAPSAPLSSLAVTSLP